MGCGFTSRGQESGSVFSTAVCKIQASKHYVESLPLPHLSSCLPDVMHVTLSPRPSPSLRFLHLQVIKNWRREWPGNETHSYTNSPLHTLTHTPAQLPCPLVMIPETRWLQDWLQECHNWHRTYPKLRYSPSLTPSLPPSPPSSLLQLSVHSFSPSPFSSVLPSPPFLSLPSLPHSSLFSSFPSSFFPSFLISSIFLSFLLQLQLLFFILLSPGAMDAPPWRVSSPWLPAWTWVPHSNWPDSCSPADWDFWVYESCLCISGAQTQHTTSYILNV